MLGLPLELITMLFSTLLGGVMSIWGQSMKNRQEQNKMMLQTAQFRADQVNTNCPLYIDADHEISLSTAGTVNLTCIMYQFTEI